MDPIRNIIMLCLEFRTYELESRDKSIDQALPYSDLQIRGITLILIGYQGQAYPHI